MKELMTIPEVAELARVTRATVYTWIKTRGLRAVRVGSRLRVTKADWLAFINREDESQGMENEVNKRGACIAA